MKEVKEIEVRAEGRRYEVAGKKSPMNDVEIVGVTWDYYNKRAKRMQRSGSIAREVARGGMKKAQAIYDEKEAKGLNPVIVISWCGFFL